MSTTNHNPIPAPTESRHAGVAYTPAQLAIMRRYEELRQSNPPLADAMRKLITVARDLSGIEWASLNVELDADPDKSGWPDIITRFCDARFIPEDAADACHYAGCESVFDIGEILDSEPGFTRLAIARTSVWVCDHCSEFSDPDCPDCTCHAEDEADADLEETE
jgi:hypothetical protein